MKRIHILFFSFALLLLAGTMLAQEAPPAPSFNFVQQLGQARPQGIVYNPPLDQFAWVDTRGRLLLVDATTYQTQHILYEAETYNAYAFSHNGRMLALALGRRVELWDTQTGTQLALLEPDGANSTTGPLLFSDEDDLLLFTAIVPAPQELRRSENDTSNLPWLWDIPAALNQANSTLVGRVDAYPFFEFRNGLILTPNDKLVAARPGRIEVLDITSDGFPVIAELETARNEQDPIDLWFSLHDEQVYFRPVDQNGLFQIDSRDGSITSMPLGRELNHNTMPALQDLILSDQARIIGQPNSREVNSLLRLLLGDNYLASWNYHPITVYLLDILQPVTVSKDQMGVLVYILDEQTGRGSLDFVRPLDVLHMALHPEDTHFLARRASGSQPVEVYHLDSGVLETTITPALHDLENNHVLAYNATGSTILSDFQRFDARTGAVVYEDLSYNYGFDSYFFHADSQKMVTLAGEDWWLWDIASGEVIRREKVRLRGALLQTSPDAARFLTALDTPAGPAREIVEIGQDDRPMVVFENLPNASITDIVASPNWENYLVMYAPDPASSDYPGSIAALYNLYEGKRWFISGDDLPPAIQTYGWLDNEPAYIYGEFSESFGIAVPQRVYGLEFHPSGLPACLVAAFPDEWQQWLPLWERLNANWRPDSLARLAQHLCDALPASVAEVDAIFNPSPVPTRVPVTPLPAVIAGAPECLTQRFPNEAVQYARDWREITAGLSTEEIAEMEELLCAGLTGSESPPFPETRSHSTARVMTIDITTGQRHLGTFIPRVQAAPQPNLQLVLNEFERAQQVRPGDSLLSPDAQLLATRSRTNHILIFGLVKPYEAIVAEATATAVVVEAGSVDEEPRRISVRPTATQPFENLGQPRPTLTPTVTPTSPPPPTEQVAQEAYGQVEEVCEAASTVYDISAPPPGYAATGRLFTYTDHSASVWVVDATSGAFYEDDRLPRCHSEINCNFSFDQNWILTYTDDIRVSRPDGSAAWVLFDAAEQPVWPHDIYWLDNDTLEFSYTGYLPERSLDPVTLYRRAEVETRQLSEPFPPPPAITINQLLTDTLSTQPGGTLAVVRTSFNSGSSGTGYKYYIYDRATGEADYFARLVNAEELLIQWHPLGKALYYRYTTDETWYVYDPQTHQHRVLGSFPDGQWSRDGRYRVGAFRLPFEENEARRLAGQPIPTLRVWDSETGLMRHYCVPTPDPYAALGIEQPTPPPGQDAAPGLPTGTPLPPAPETVTFAAPSWIMLWSPDSRYIALQVVMHGGNGEISTEFSTLFILDTLTGAFTEIPVRVNTITVWTDSTAEAAR